jgi:6-pyruvoyltetrahydropterin/6-carboxytetrahydropterin synthase
MYRLEKSFTFEASHQLPNHDGKCKHLHGHSWHGKLIVEGQRLNLKGPKVGMLVDYGDLSIMVRYLRDEFLDHYHLNESLGMENPTSENIARWIFKQLYKQLPDLVAVVIEETCTTSCEFRPDKKKLVEELKE